MSTEKNKYAIVVLTDSTQPADRGRMVHALKLRGELSEAGHTVELCLCGKGVTWATFFLAEKAKDEPHPYAKQYGHLFHGADVTLCNMCTIRFDVHETVTNAGMRVEGEGRDHMALGKRVLEGYQVITF